MLEELIELGLTRGEARVFYSLLKLGSAKVGEVVKDSAVSYSKIYDVLERLASKGLVSHITVGNVKHFNAVEPYRLQEYLEKKEADIQAKKELARKIIPELAKVTDNNRKKNSAEIFVGDRGLRTGYEVLLAGASKGQVLRYFYPYEGYHPSATPFYSRFHLFQKQKRLEERGIATINFKKSNHFKELPKDVKLRFVSFPLPATMDIFGDKMLIISWETKTGILISSKEIANHFTGYFDSLWKIARR